MAWSVLPANPLAAGTDLPTGFLAGDTSIARNRCVLEGLYLGPCNDLGTTDNGQATTAAPAAGVAGIPDWWGRRRGNWVAADVDRVDVLVANGSDPVYGCVTTWSSINWEMVFVVGGNILFTFHNVGPGDAGPLRLTFIYWQSFDR